MVTGGHRHERGGTFFTPTVLADVKPEMLLAREETFGPVAPVFRFSSEAEAVGMANDTEFGLAAYFYSRDIARCLRVGEALEYGMIGVNTGLISNEVFLRGCQAVGNRPRGLQAWAGRVSGDQVPVFQYTLMARAL